MKFWRFFLISVLLLGVTSCKKKSNSRRDLATVPVDFQMTDISAEMYNTKIPFDRFKNQYRWFLDPDVPDSVYIKKRSDVEEMKIYREALQKLDVQNLKAGLTGLFGRVKNFDTHFQPPHVYLFSSATQMALEPILYAADKDLLFIDLSGFLGEQSKYYDWTEQYFRSSMTPQNLLPKTSYALADQFVGQSLGSAKFIDQIVTEGKKMALQDSFLPDEPDHLKFGYTAKQQEWAVQNEAQVWNFFVENNLIYSDSPDLYERFIAPGPFSKFYAPIDNEAAPRIGAWIGWQICREYLEKHPDVSLKEFLQTDASTLFTQSGYRP
ncbi:MAG: gliding motility protein GldB [Chryseobacterium sp.]|nr:MAG: gliding motility protein GldB [Chryseobacterium sp.]